ncbi:copine family protein 1-like [Ruditapes philippinarum]|uniref:copine family protein 1-like n=1 Tax=Ruditapes philippinarum TaxID=129788 RepID=UPI00295AA0E2|nr:copine family protein 1-like [Ruditapes philippinarum]
MNDGFEMCDSVSGKRIDGDVVHFGSESEEENDNIIRDEFHTLDEVQEAIRKQGLETCNLIFGIDYTMSNKSQGLKTFEGRNLHSISDTLINPYQKVMCILGETLEPFDEDGIIPVFGFGDKKCRDKYVFELKPGTKCEGFSDVLDVYNEVTPTIKLGGPTNFAPLIEKAIEIVRETNEYHILVIVADGQVSSEEATKKALIEASHYPISIVVVGVGDGPWGSMKTFDDGLTERKFDNFQFVNFHEVMNKAENPEAAFALNALMEIPEQYKYLKQAGLIQ